MVTRAQEAKIREIVCPAIRLLDDVVNLEVGRRFTMHLRRQIGIDY
jgi:hypothetical protein